jgi:hypothetical protein
MSSLLVDGLIWAVNIRNPFPVFMIVLPKLFKLILGGLKKLLGLSISSPLRMLLKPIENFTGKSGDF